MRRPARCCCSCDGWGWRGATTRSTSSNSRCSPGGERRPVFLPAPGRVVGTRWPRRTCLADTASRVHAGPRWGWASLMVAAGMSGWLLAVASPDGARTMTVSAPHVPQPVATAAQDIQHTGWVTAVSSTSLTTADAAGRSTTFAITPDTTQVHRPGATGSARANTSSWSLSSVTEYRWPPRSSTEAQRTGQVSRWTTACRPDHPCKVHTLVVTFVTFGVKFWRARRRGDVHPASARQR